jgi:hypothetical protein
VVWNTGSRRNQRNSMKAPVFRRIDYYQVL